MNQKTIIAVLGVAVIILFGTTIYFATINKKSQSTPTPATKQSTTPAPVTQQPTTNQSTPTIPANTQNYIEVKELGFKIPVDSVMASELTYKVVDNSIAWFSSKTLNSISKYCEDGAGGAISKVMGTPSNPASGDPEYYKARLSDLNGRTFIKQFEGFFLLWSGPQAPCTATEKDHVLESKIIEVIANGFKNVSLINK